MGRRVELLEGRPRFVSFGRVLGIFYLGPRSSLPEMSVIKGTYLINSTRISQSTYSIEYKFCYPKTKTMLSKSSIRISTQCLRQTTRSRSLVIASTRRISSKPSYRTNAFTTLRCLKAQVTDLPSQVRGFASKTAADEVIEEITELYVYSFPAFAVPHRKQPKTNYKYEKTR